MLNKHPALLKKALSAFAVLIFWIAVWYAAAAIVGYELILPSPLNVIISFGGLIRGGEIFAAVGASLLRVMIGYIAGVAAGVVTALLTDRSAVLRQILAPMLTVIKSTPVASFIMLAWMFVGNEKLPILVSFMMVLPIIWQNTEAGLSAMDKELSEVAEIYELKFAKKLRIFIIPSLLSFVIPALITSMGLAWKAGIAAEVISHCKNSIGNGIYESKTYLETPELFAWTAIVIVLSLIIEWLLKLLGRRLMKFERI